MPTLSQILLYLASANSLLTVAGHTKMGYDVVFPSLKKSAVTGEKGASGKGVRSDVGVVSARIGWMEVNLCFVLASILSLKWAANGCSDPYDQALMAAYSAVNVYFGFSYASNGIYPPLLALWGIPALFGLSRVV